MNPSRNRKSNSHVNFFKTKLDYTKFKEMDEECYKPDNYFNFEINPIMGKGHKGPRFDDRDLILHSVVGRDKYKEFQDQYSRSPNAKARLSFRMDTKAKKSTMGKHNLTNLSKIHTIQSQDANIRKFQIINHMELERLYQTIDHSISTNPIKVHFLKLV